MTNEQIENKVLSRLRKMLALANDAAATEAERDTALQMSYKLLAKHNLSMVDVSEHELQQTDPRDKYSSEDYSMMWARHVNNIIADLFFCKYFFGQKINAYKCKHHFVGKESNATTALLMAQFINASIVKEVRARYGHALVPDARAFAVGAVSKLRERVRLLKAEQTAEQSSGTSLVLANLYDSEARANALTIQNLGITVTTKTNTTKAVNSTAYGAGKEYGKSISLSPQVGNTKVPKSRQLT